MLPNRSTVSADGEEVTSVSSLCPRSSRHFLLLPLFGFIVPRDLLRVEGSAMADAAAIE
jgi:hypothetical protein